MKAITFETTLKTVSPDRNNYGLVSEFNVLQHAILNCPNIDELRLRLSKFEQFSYFVFGFGASHFWVKQIGHEMSSERVIFVTFN